MAAQHPNQNIARRLSVESLEPRSLLAATANLVAGVLTVNGTPDRDNISVAQNTSGQLIVRNFAKEIGRFASASVTSITLLGGAGDDILSIDRNVGQPAVLNGGPGKNILRGGSGATQLIGGGGNDKLTAGSGQTAFTPGGGQNTLLNVKTIDTGTPGPKDRIGVALPVIVSSGAAVETLTEYNVRDLLKRASLATASNDAIIAIVDRNGRLLGLRTEAGVDPAIMNNPDALVFAVDGALSEARTAAFFGNDQAPLTSRTIQYISQSTITQREVESNPSIADINSTLRGPGFVAPIGIKNHFPPNIPNTPQVDLFLIEHTNRDKSTTANGKRFNANFIPGQELVAPDSYGKIRYNNDKYQSRGIGTLPGGIPIYKNNQLVGGIGVFFPGKTGYASEENSSLDAKYDPSKPDRSLEAEYIAFAAVGGAPGIGKGIGTIAGCPPVTGISVPLTQQNQRIDLVGITLDIIGPGGLQGPDRLIKAGSALGTGQDSGINQPVNVGGDTLLRSKPVPEGYLVKPQDGDGITAAEVQQIIQQGIDEANSTRAAIRLPLNSSTKMVFAVADRQGAIVGLYRMPDATVFSVDVAVAKARNVAYYASDRLQPVDQLPGVPLNTALTNRSIRYLALPRFPEGIDSASPGPFSILNDGGVDPHTGLNVGAPLPASAYQSVQGYDAFNPGTNFRDPANKANQNGIVFFPGSSALYTHGTLKGGFGVSGDGVDQDDVVTSGGASGFEPPSAMRIDEVFVRGIRVPYKKFNRNPHGGI